MNASSTGFAALLVAASLLVWNVAGCSNDREGSAAKSPGPRGGAVEPGPAQGMGSGGGRGLGAGQGGGRGQGMGMGRGRLAGAGNASGFEEGSANAGPALDREADRASAEENSELKGRTIVEQGTLTTVEGKLKRSGNEWQLVSGNDIHNIHLGPEEYRQSQGVEIEEGAQAVVRGFSIGDEIAVCSMEVSGTTWVFRNQDGRPAWGGGGQGRGRNRVLP